MYCSNTILDVILAILVYIKSDPAGISNALIDMN